MGLETTTLRVLEFYCYISHKRKKWESRILFSAKEYSGKSISRLTQAVSEVFHFAASILFIYFFFLGNEQWELPGRFRVFWHEAFFCNRLVYVSWGLDISQGVFQKISTRQKKSQKVVCSQENIQSGLSSKEDAWCFGKGSAGYHTCKWKAQYQATALGGYSFLSTQTEKEVYY